MQATSGFVGVCGPTAFGEDREAALKVVVKLLVDGRLQPLEKLTAAPPPKTATKSRTTVSRDGETSACSMFLIVRSDKPARFPSSLRDRCADSRRVRSSVENR